MQQRFFWGQNIFIRLHQTTLLLETHGPVFTQLCIFSVLKYLLHSDSETDGTCLNWRRDLIECAVRVTPHLYRLFNWRINTGSNAKKGPDVYFDVYTSISTCFDVYWLFTMACCWLSHCLVHTLLSTYHNHEIICLLSRKTVVDETLEITFNIQDDKANLGFAYVGILTLQSDKSDFHREPQMTQLSNL